MRWIRGSYNEIETSIMAKAAPAEPSFRKDASAFLSQSSLEEPFWRQMRQPVKTMINYSHHIDSVLSSTDQCAQTAETQNIGDPRLPQVCCIITGIHGSVDYPENRACDNSDLRKRHQRSILD